MKKSKKRKHLPLIGIGPIEQRDVPFCSLDKLFFYRVQLLSKSTLFVNFALNNL